MLLLSLPAVLAHHADGSGNSGGIGGGDGENGGGDNGGNGGSDGGNNSGGGTGPVPNDKYVVLAWNDLGMHCIDDSFADFSVLPPYNTLVAQVIKRGKEPKILTQGIRVSYRIVGNTRSDSKTDFWRYVKQLFGVSPAPNVGLAGFGLQGDMRVNGDSFIAEGIPLVPYLDSAPTILAPYQVAAVEVHDLQGNLLAATRTVAPVSTEMRCDTCHGDHGRANPAIATGVTKQNILTLHDREEGTALMANRPVLCASCHGSNALQQPGDPDLPSLSRAIHGKHKEIDDGTMAGTCYRCHPGEQTKCLRGIMFQNGKVCQDCHGNLRDLADKGRRPWLDEPRCGQCHDPAYSEPAGTLYRFSRGHHGVFCQACHGSQHAVYPTVIAEDNMQSLRLQGHSGTIDTCQVCHTNDPDHSEGPHKNEGTGDD